MGYNALMEFLRANVYQDAINTFAITELRCPVSRTELMAMLIHSIELRVDASEPDLTKTAQGHISCNLLTRIFGTGAGISTPGVLELAVSEREIWTLGTEELISDHDEIPLMHYYNPPILYPRDTMYLSVWSLYQLALHGADVKIGYTLEKVSQQAFIAALVD